MENLSLIDKLLMVSIFGSSSSVFLWLGFVLYLKSKWLPFLEDTLDNGVRFYTLNIFFAGQGVLQYATVFLWSFHARRYGMLEKRDNVPKPVQRLFIFAFCWFMVSVVLAGAGAVCLEFMCCRSL